MKKLLIATSLLTLTTTSAFAATTGDLILRGQVGRVLAITVTAQSVAQQLDLATSQSSLKVATLNEQSNVATGYKIIIKSDNQGNLLREGGAETFAYNLTYGGVPLTTLGTTTGQTFTSTSTALGTNVNKDIGITYAGKAAMNMVEGFYGDTVRFEIQAN